MGWSRFFRRRYWDEERARELESHLEIETEENIARGMPVDQARQAARRKLGNPTRIREEIFGMNSIEFIDGLWQDVRFGLRSLLKDRGLLVTAVLALALGIGATTAIFSVIDSVLVEPFPYREGREIMTIRIHDASRPQPFGRDAFSPPEFLDYEQQNRVFDRVMGARSIRYLMSKSGAAPEAFTGAEVTGNAFQFLGVPALLGRTASPQDAKPNAPGVLVLSYRIWQGRFASDPGILGKTLVLNEKPITVIGIMPPRFTLWGADFWVPTTFQRGDTDPSKNYIGLLGHLKSGLNVKSAEADLTILAQRFSKIYPKEYPKKFDVLLVSMAAGIVGQFSQTLYILLGAVGLLLLIACANVANLLLAKAAGRQKEFAIRASLGAGRVAVTRQLLVESVLLALMGAAAGCLLAWTALKGLIAAMPPYTLPSETVIQMNGRVLAASLFVAIVTALIFGLAPALGAFAPDLTETLKASAHGNSGFRRAGLRNALIVGEVALGLILLTGAGLLMRSFLLQRDIQLGLATDKLLTSQIWFGAKYRTADDQSRFLRDLLPRLQHLPGVLSASGAADFPPFGGIRTDFDAAGVTHSEKWRGQMGFCDAQYFSTIGLRLMRGRLLTEADVNGKRKVAVVNQTLAAKFFPGQDPVGKQIELIGLAKQPTPVANPWFEIVGVTSDVKNQGVTEDILPEAYAPVTFSSFGGYVLFLRTAGNPVTLAKDIEAVVMKMDKSLTPQETFPMNELLEIHAYAKPRFSLQIFSVFAAIGLVLVTVGVYSVVSYTVSQQTREIGIRMALGASARTVRGLVISTGMRFILVGVAIGLAIAFGLLRLLASQIWGISTYDPLTLAGVVLVLAAVGLAACYLPSRRATRVDPLVSLRYE